MIKWKEGPSLSWPADGPDVADPYKILGVPKSFGLGEIRSAYLRLVRLFHPDHRHPFMKSIAEERLKVITAAWHAIREEREHGK